MRPALRSSVAAPVLMAACTVTPPPAAVELPAPVPAEWGTPAAGAEPGARIGAEWWRAFGDPLLDDCVERALAHNTDLQAAGARLAAAAEVARIAGADRTPQVDLALDAQRGRQLFLGFPFGGTAVPSSTVTTFGASLNLSWEIDLWGRLAAGEAAALADLQAETALFAGAQQSLIAQTCKAYFAVVEARQQLDLSVATEASVRATTEDVRDRFRRGLRPAIDTFQALTNLHAAEDEVAQRGLELQAAVRQLEILLGGYPAGTAASAAVLAGDLPEVPAGLPSSLLGRRPDLAAAERRLAAAGCRVAEARAALYPRISLTASGGTSSLDLEDLVDETFRVWSIGGNLLQPLLRGGALRAELARTEAVQQEAIANYGGTVLRAFAEVETALAGGVRLGARETAATAAAQSAAAARDLARERYQSGLTDFLAVADGQRQAFRAESTAIAVRRLRAENRIDLILSLGGGFEAAPPAVREASTP